MAWRQLAYGCAVSLKGSALSQTHQYTWVESYSDEHERPFFFNQETKVSTWDKPPDLGERAATAMRLPCCSSAGPYLSRRAFPGFK